MSHVKVGMHGGQKVAVCSVCQAAAAIPTKRRLVAFLAEHRHDPRRKKGCNCRKKRSR